MTRGLHCVETSAAGLGFWGIAYKAVFNYF